MWHMLALNQQKVRRVHCRVLILTLLIACKAGRNFTSICLLWKYTTIIAVDVWSVFIFVELTEQLNNLALFACWTTNRMYVYIAVFPFGVDSCSIMMHVICLKLLTNRLYRTRPHFMWKYVLNNMTVFWLSAFICPYWIDGMLCRSTWTNRLWVCTTILLYACSTIYESKLLHIYVIMFNN